MNFNSKSASFLILAVTAIVFSRIMFFFFNDPEGPNVLVVAGMAAVVYLLSLGAYALSPAVTISKRLSLIIVIQIVLVGALYFLLK